jgi:Carboxypeptidase regulatory-like domain
MRFKKPLSMWLAVASMLTLLAMSASTLMAQSAGTSGLAGTVTDPSGAAVPNVTVTIISNDTGQTRTATTGADGTYKFGLLPPGTYHVRFAATGFKTAEVGAVTLNVTETPELNRTLEIGQQTEEVTVEATAETLQTQSSTLGSVAGTAEVTGLPLSNRNYTQILSLAAGANAAVNDARSLGKGTQDMSVNGNSPGSNNFQMDGVAINSIAHPDTANDVNIYAGIGIPSPDAIQEFKVQTSTYDASYGRNPGANVNVLTKSGSNQFHGTAFEFFRNADLDANDFFYNRDTCSTTYAGQSCPHQVLNLNQFGGVIGGPIKKDKLFFFGSYQGTREKNGVASPQGFTDAILPPIPAGTRSTSPTSAWAQQLAALNCGNASFGPNLACNGSNLSQVALNILNLKLPNGQYYFPSSGASTLTNVAFSIPALYNADQTVINGDYLINSKNTLAMRYFYTRDPQTVPLNGNLPGVPSTDYYSNTDASIKLTTIVTNTMVNELRGSMQRNLARLTDTEIPGSTPQDLGITPLVPGLQLPPGIDILTGNYTMFNTFNPAFSPTTGIQISDQISWSRGKHTIRAGYEYEENQWNIVYQGFERGWLLMGTFNDFLVGGPGNELSCIFCVAGPEQGVVHGYRLPDQNAFVQDDYKVSSKFTVNLGIRWEYDGSLSDKYGNLTNLWTSELNSVPVPPTGPNMGANNLVGWVVPNNYSTATYGPVPAGVLQNSGNLPISSHVPLSNFAPRVGFADQITSKLVLRGGFGLFYDRVDVGALVHGLEQGPPYSGTADVGSGNQQTLSNPFPVTPIGVFPQRYFNPACLTAAPTAAAPIPCNSPTYNSYLSAPFVYQDMHTPLVRQYNLNLQYEFAKNWVLETAYVGSSGINLLDAYHNYNTALLASASDPINGQTTNSLQNVALRVPYLGYQPVGVQGSAFDGVSNYNSLQVTLRKSFSHGLLVQASYTYSKDLTDINYYSGGAVGANINNASNLAQQYGPAYFSRPQRVVINYSYDLPFGTHQGVTGKLLGGWNVSGVTTIQDGGPMTIVDPNAGTIYGTASVASTAEICPGYTYGQTLSSGGLTSRLGGNSGGPGYFNSSAFCSAPTGGIYGNGTGFGNSGVGVVLGPGQFNWDITIVKTTRITERQTLIFRTEFFNTFNHAQFNNPLASPAPGLAQLGPTFGEITSTSVNPRILQFGLKYMF